MPERSPTGDQGKESGIKTLEKMPSVKLIFFLLKLLVVEEKQTAGFKVSVEANPPPTISWKFGETALDTDADERFSQEADGSLKLTNASLEDEGVYTVMADNGLGRIARYQFTLKVQPEKMDIEVRGRFIRVATKDKFFPPGCDRRLRPHVQARHVHRSPVLRPRLPHPRHPLVQEQHAAAKVGPNQRQRGEHAGAEQGHAH